MNSPVIILALTSNKGSQDFQMLPVNEQEFLFERVLKVTSTFGNGDNTMYVVGATKAEYLSKVRKIVPNHFLLIPGIGKQGGDLEQTLTLGANKEFGLLINSSRGIIYASDEEDFDHAARQEVIRLNAEMRPIMTSMG